MKNIDSIRDIAKKIVKLQKQVRNAEIAWIFPKRRPQTNWRKRIPHHQKSPRRIQISFTKYQRRHFTTRAYAQGREKYASKRKDTCTLSDQNKTSKDQNICRQNAGKI